MIPNLYIGNGWKSPNINFLMVVWGSRCKFFFAFCRKFQFRDHLHHPSVTASSHWPTVASARWPALLFLNIKGFFVNIETYTPKNQHERTKHPIEKASHLPNLHFWSSILIFQGVSFKMKFPTCGPSFFHQFGDFFQLIFALHEALQANTAKLIKQFLGFFRWRFFLGVRVGGLNSTFKYTLVLMNGWNPNSWRWMVQVMFFSFQLGDSWVNHVCFFRGNHIQGLQRRWWKHPKKSDVLNYTATTQTTEILVRNFGLEVNWFNFIFCHEQAF